ncbi:DUF1129 domain-containing protein [Liquorilactobacillus mali]|uniref:DUF1129 domain-containing protein n=1 Tax=Liquorilactobacillus mali TaxID=1618 RepID=UPI000704D8FF|nr:DUF1129 domain-containing protein [Liquorilactobacillus mali]MDN7145738.1 DUF1129 domain-containing protein [Liquorilactobacillus mali]
MAENNKETESKQTLPNTENVTEKVEKKDTADLTKRNVEYLFKIKKVLEEKNVASQKIEDALQAMAEELKEKQRQGITATKLYGTVNEKAEEIIKGPKKAPTATPFWKIALDNGLMMFIMFCIMYAILQQFSPNSSQINGGFLTLIVTSVIAGVAMAYFYRAAGDRRTKGKKVPFWKTMLLSLLLVIIWVSAYTLVVNVSGVINQTLEPIVYVILAVLVFGLRYFLKKKYDIKSTPF